MGKVEVDWMPAERIESRSQFSVVFDALRELVNPPNPPRKPIGYRVQERRAAYRPTNGRGRP